MKIIVEPSGAVAYGAVVEGSSIFAAAGSASSSPAGNLDLDTLPWINAAGG